MSYSVDMNQHYTLDNFIVKSSNEDAFFGALSVIKKPVHYNPLFLYGGMGVGKTHLLQSIAEEFEKTYEKPVLFVNARRFIDDFLFSLKNKCGWRFNQKYRNNNLLIIDDFHQVAGKRLTEQQILIIFKAMELEHRQIVLSSDRHLNAIQDLDHDLKSYCMGGLALGMAN